MEKNEQLPFVNFKNLAAVASLAGAAFGFVGADIATQSQDLLAADQLVTVQSGLPERKVNPNSGNDEPLRDHEPLPPEQHTPRNRAERRGITPRTYSTHAITTHKHTAKAVFRNRGAR